MNLTFLAKASPQEVYQAGQQIIRRAGAERFILGVADVLLGNHAVENVEALVRAGHEYELSANLGRLAGSGPTKPL